MIDELVKQITRDYSPQKVILFGSQAKGTASAKSDIDLCIIAETENKRRTLADMYLNIQCDRPIDLLLYTPQEWADCMTDETSFAHKLSREGKVLYG